MEVPKEVKRVVRGLKKAGFEAYVVGGCVRDMLRGAKPTDWDVATNAPPRKTEDLFPRVFTVEEFGLVTVLTGSPDPSLREIEIMPYRREAEYEDRRHPEKIEWADSIEEDLSRRDFTVNAMAVKPGEEKVIVDPFGGREDLKKQLIRAVGSPGERFSEDALRLMRGVRFGATLGPDWKMEEKTRKALKENEKLLKAISKERIRDEFVKIIMSPGAKKGMELLRETGLLEYVVPELTESVGVEQNKHHVYNCWEHAVRSLDYAAQHGYSKTVRLAALLHDVAKPRVKEGRGEEATFYNHEVVGARMTEKILRRLRFSSQTVKKVRKLVRWHLFYYTPEEVTESSVRKLVRNAGRENIGELLQVRYADRIGSGCPKARPYKLRHLQYVVEKTDRDPVSVEKLKIDGDKVMETMNIEPGPKVGKVLTILLSEVLDDPEKNDKEYLVKRMRDLKKQEGKEFEKETRIARREVEEVRTKRDEMLKKKYWVH